MTADEPLSTSIDGPIAAPDHHRVVFENDHVRVFETIIAPSDTAPLHTHASPHLTIMVGGDAYIRRGAAGQVLLEVHDGDATPDAPRYSWSDGLPAHTLENIGTSAVVATTIELKGASPVSDRRPPR